jgi:riboflavin synthase
MFTGLIEGTGTLIRVERAGADSSITIGADCPLDDLQLGESVAVEGVCLTVVSFQGRQFVVDVSVETLSRTTLGRKPPGSPLNLERALRLGDRLGGHLVSGHVDGIGSLLARIRDGRSWRLSFRMPEHLGPYVIPKGSIAVNGISLTVNTCDADRFEVNVVPHTALMTTIDSLKIGDEVNLETDLIGKYLDRLLKARFGETPGPSAKTGIDIEFLRRHGFSG